MYGILKAAHVAPTGESNTKHPVTQQKKTTTTNNTAGVQAYPKARGPVEDEADKAHNGELSIKMVENGAKVCGERVCELVLEHLKGNRHHRDQRGQHKHHNAILIGREVLALMIGLLGTHGTDSDVGNSFQHRVISNG
jgi:hypothetical protein